MTNRPAALVTLTGGAGAGKTTLARALAASVVHLDDYYHFGDSDHGVWVPDESGTPQLDVGDPRSIDVVGVEAAVNEALRDSAVVVVDGLFAIDVQPSKPCVRLDAFVDLAADLRLARKIYRKCVVGDFPVEVLLANYVDHRRTAHERHVEPARARCDLVVDARLPTDQLAEQIRRAIDELSPDDRSDLSPRGDPELVQDVADVDGRRLG
jgi:uridine kinase